MIKIELVDGQFVLTNDDTEVIRTKNHRRILREARNIFEIWVRELNKRGMLK